MTDLHTFGESDGALNFNAAVASLVSLVTGAPAEVLAGRLTPARLKAEIDERVLPLLDAIYGPAAAAPGAAEPAPRSFIRDGRLDPVAAWLALPPEVQREIGAAVIANQVGRLGVAIAQETGVPEQARPYDVAASEAGSLIFERIVVFVLGGEDTVLPPRPDLRPLGIAQCRVCGCTDEMACDEGCYWVEPDLCSTCAPDRAA